GTPWHRRFGHRSLTLTPLFPHLKPKLRGHLEKLLLLRATDVGDSYARSAKRSRRDVEVRHLKMFVRPIKRFGKIIGGGVADSQRVEPEAPFDHVEHGGVVVEAVLHVAACSPWRNDERGDAEAAQAVAAEQRVGGRYRRASG